jgi:hypothetical protein
MAVEQHEIQNFMEAIRLGLPGLAEELEAEFLAGRTIVEDETTVSEVPYTPEEQLELIRRGLITLAETMSASRAALAGFADRFGVEPEIEFSDGDPSTTSVHRNLLGQAGQVQGALGSVHEWFGRIEQERGR